MKIFRLIVPVSDISLAQSFYKDLLGFEGVRVSPGRHYFDCDGVILACLDSQADGDGLISKPNPEHIYISTDELEDVFQRAKILNAANLLEIETQPWGEKSFYFNDPFGNPLCFVDSKTVFTGK